MTNREYDDCLVAVYLIEREVGQSWKRKLSNEIPGRRLSPTKPPLIGPVPVLDHASDLLRLEQLAAPSCRPAFSNGFGEPSSVIQIGGQRFVGNRGWVSALLSRHVRKLCFALRCQLNWHACRLPSRAGPVNPEEE